MSVIVPVGLDLILYYNASNAYNSPSWTALSTVKDLNTPFEKDAAEAFARLSPVKQFVRGLKAFPLEFNILRDLVLTDWAILQASFTGDVILDMAIANGSIATNGTIYFRADFMVFGFKVKEPLSDASTADVEMKNYYSSNPKAYVTVGS